MLLFPLELPLVPFCALDDAVGVAVADVLATEEEEEEEEEDDVEEVDVLADEEEEEVEEVLGSAKMVPNDGT